MDKRALLHVLDAYRAYADRRAPLGVLDAYGACKQPHISCMGVHWTCVGLKCGCGVPRGTLDACVPQMQTWTHFPATPMVPPSHTHGYPHNHTHSHPAVILADTLSITHGVYIGCPCIWEKTATPAESL